MQYGGKKKAKLEYMLYDMEKDPKQFTNLAGKNELAKVEQILRKRLNERIEAAKKARNQVE